LNSLFSICRWAAQEGIAVATRVIKVEVQTCNSYVSRHLAAREGEDVTKVERVRIGNREPLMFEVLWIPTRFCPDLHLQDMSGTPLHDILRDVYALPLSKAVESIEPVAPDEYIKRLSSPIAITAGTATSSSSSWTTEARAPPPARG
jgi:GntR family transcriptional regulator